MYAYAVRVYLLWTMRVNRVTVPPLTAFTRATERVRADVAFLPPPRVVVPILRSRSSRTYDLRDPRESL